MARAASEEPNKFAAQEAYAEFLERYGDPNAREAYGRALAAAQRANDKAETAEASHSLAVLDLIAGDRDAAARHAEIYHERDRTNAAHRQARRLRCMAYRAYSGADAFFCAHGRHCARSQSARYPARPGAQRNHQRLRGVARQ